MKCSRQILQHSAVLLLVLTGALSAAAEIEEHDRQYYAGRSRACVYTNAAGRTMPYRLFVPDGAAPPEGFPLVLVLHGAGSRGNDNTAQLKPWFAGWMDDAVQKEHPCLILIPQCPDGQRWVNQPWRKGSYSMLDTPISEPLKLAKEILDEVCRSLPVDTRRIYVMGASMGGYGAWYFAAAFPDVPAAVVAVCGAGDPSMAPRLKDIPIWAFHGARDTTVPPSGSQDMVDAIQQAAGTKVRLTIYPDADHGAFKLAWKDPELLRWLFSQRR